MDIPKQIGKYEITNGQYRRFLRAVEDAGGDEKWRHPAQPAGKDNTPKANFEPGIDLMAKVTVLGEGARGSLTKQLEQKLNLHKGRLPQVYETGIKEVIELPDKKYFAAGPANVMHLMGYPL